MIPGQIEAEKVAARVVNPQKMQVVKQLFPEDTQTPEQRIVSSAGRPTLRFVDVGPKFLDIKDRLRRDKESARRSKVRSRRTLKAQALEKASTATA